MLRENEQDSSRLCVLARRWWVCRLAENVRGGLISSFVEDFWLLGTWAPGFLAARNLSARKCDRPKFSDLDSAARNDKLGRTAGQSQCWWRQGNAEKDHLATVPFFCIRFQPNEHFAREKTRGHLWLMDCQQRQRHEAPDHFWRGALTRWLTVSAAVY